ncbi:MAG TPA: protease modulator HflC [Verrucomicrobiota bacterium]|nr:protease modulator HflC [Verrucomicrobiota bacterium]HNU51415.1 protease modulator HflC [Verrucomicrobiota bacterium]
MKYHPVTLVTGLVVAAIFAAMLVCFQVRQTEVAVVTTFGRFSRTIDKPGFNLRLPWPIQSVHRFDNRVRNFERKYEQVTTRDARLILIDVFLGWKIKDARVFLERFGGDQMMAEERLEGILRDAKNGVVGQHPLSDFISPNPSELRFDAIEKEMLASVKPKALENYGVEVVLLGIKQIGLPQSITEKVFERMKAERDQLVKQFQGEGAGEAIRIRSEADLRRDQILAEAEAKATVIRGNAEQQAARALRTFEQNPELAVFLLKLDALEQALKERSTLVVDTRTPPFDLLRTPPTPATSK